jgi:membrane protein required for colicin V production
MAEWPVNPVDIGVFLVILVSGLLAYVRGFVHEVLSVAGWIGAILATIYGFPHARPYARDLIPHAVAADLVAGVVIFIFTLVILSLVTRAISKRVQDSALNVLDRSLGFVFGLARGAVLIALAYIPLEWMLPVPEQPPWLRAARTMPLIESGAALLKSLVPENNGSRGGTLGNGRDPAKALQDSQKALRDMLSADPKGAPGQPRDGYGTKERRDMERLLESSK